MLSVVRGEFRLWFDNVVAMHENWYIPPPTYIAYIYFRLASVGNGTAVKHAAHYVS